MAYYVSNLYDKNVILDLYLVNFFSYNVVENEAHFLLERPLNNLIRDNFPSLFEECSSKKPQVFLSVRPSSWH